jgi:hypothetical protein
MAEMAEMAEMAARRDASNAGQASMTATKPSSNKPVVADVVAPSAESRSIGPASAAGSVSSHIANANAGRLV